MTAPREVNIDGWRHPARVVGNAALLRQSKAGYFCSLKYPAAAVAPSYEWARQMRDGGQCVISGFHSLLEEHVRDVLLMGQAPAPVIWVIPRRVYTKNMPAWAGAALAADNLLIVSISDTTQASASNTKARNRFIMAVADTITVGYASPGGKLSELLKASDKPVRHLTPPAVAAVV